MASRSELDGISASAGLLDTQELAVRFSDVRSASVSLAAPLSAEDCCAQSMEDASPVKWHLAHTTWFFETFVLGESHSPFDASFRELFNSYYNSVGEQFSRAQRGLLTRPDFNTVLRYREAVDSAILEALGRDLFAPELRKVVELGLHHEQQHQELLLTDVLHLLSCNPQQPAYRDSPMQGVEIALSSLRWCRGPEGLQSLGHPGEGFCFDNEGPRHDCWLAPYEIASRLVSNGEYEAFIEDGGYRRPELWLSEGWSLAQQEGWEAPLYWNRRDGDWSAFGLQGAAPLRRSEPVAHVSYFEADAYARWAEARLAREEEWELIAKEPSAEDNLLESGTLRPLAPRADREGEVAQLFGDVWEWTQSAYEAYPGYRADGGALGEYNGKFMVNQYVLRGGSCVTSAAHIRASYRNFFPAHARWQWSGIRLARDA